jgi:hypothetical protein
MYTLFQRKIWPIVIGNVYPCYGMMYAKKYIRDYEEYYWYIPG